MIYCINPFLIRNNESIHKLLQNNGIIAIIDRFIHDGLIQTVRDAAEDIFRHETKS